MQNMGILVQEWPIVLGCDAGGRVEELGKGVTRFQVGDYAMGCTRLGKHGYGTFQEYVCLLHAAVSIQHTAATNSTVSYGRHPCHQKASQHRR